MLMWKTSFIVKSEFLFIYLSNTDVENCGEGFIVKSEFIYLFK